MSDEHHSLRDELEVRVVALLTGELDEGEAEELERILANDEALSAYRDRMAELMGVLHEGRDELAPPTGEPPMRLSEERRKRIFGEVGPVEDPAPRKKRRSVSWRTRVIEIAAVLTMLLILAALLIPSVGSVRQEARRTQEVEEVAFETHTFSAPDAAESVAPPEAEATTAPVRKAAPMALEEAVAESRGERIPSSGTEGHFGLGGAGLGVRESDVDGLNAVFDDDVAARERSDVDRIEVAGSFARGSGPVDPFAPSQPGADRDLPGDVGTTPLDESGMMRSEVAEASGVADFSNNGQSQVDPFAATGSLGMSSKQKTGGEGDDLRLVKRSWQRPKVFELSAAPSETRRPLHDIVIPQVNFSGMPLSQVVGTLNKLSAEYDSDGKGVRIEYRQSGDHDPRVNISLRNLSLDRILQFVTQQVNYSYDVGAEGVRIFQPSAVEQHADARAADTVQTPKAEKTTADDPFSTFSLNISDVSFRLAQAALADSRAPEPNQIRTEEFVNSFDYGDPSPRPGEAIGLNWEIARHPYAHDRQVLRFNLQTQAAGRAPTQPLNLALLVDNSGSMQRPDRQAILETSLQSLKDKLTERDRLSILLFARQPKLIAEAGDPASQQAAVDRALAYRPEGGTNLEAGLEAAYASARRHFDPAASNRVILMTDGAANLGNVRSDELADLVVEQRKQGIALDAYGIGWDGYNDALLEAITRNGDGRYAFLNSVEDAADDFSEKLAGTLRVAAADVKVQVKWNPERVKRYRQIGYDLHRLKAEDFRDNTVDAAEIGEAESGTALYVVQIDEDPEIPGGLGTLHVRYRVPSTGEYREHSWPLTMPRKIPPMDQASPALRLATAGAFFAERLAENPYGRDYDLGELYSLTAGLPEAFPSQSRVAELQRMIRTARTLYDE
ncbi:MAG: von Willebrand factor type A domain-containing protein [Opitutales bacterium]